MPRISPTGFQTMEQTAEYKTLAHFGADSFVEQRSEFIGYASPCETEEQALAFLQSIRTKHADARHCVYAYVLRENNISRFSDDHEPQGTAGMPTLSILQHGQITDACIAVVRYFGGILLGTGGLTRAYTKSAQIAVRAAGIVQRRLCLDFELAVSYSDYQKLAPLLARFEAVAEQTDYAAQVTLRGFLPVFLRQEFSAALTDFSRGSARLSFGDERYATVAQPQDRPL